MRKEITFGAIALSFMLTVCATIFSGSMQTVKFTSNPSSATIFVDEVEAGKTPLEMKIPRRNEHLVKMKLDGYQPYQTRLTQQFNGWCAGNIVFGGLIGLVVDMSTGAMYNLSPGEINAEMSNGIIDVQTTANGQNAIPSQNNGAMSNSTTIVQPTVSKQNTTPKVENTKDQLHVGDNVKFYSYKFDINMNGVVKEIKDETILIEYKSFGKMNTVKIKKSDIKKI